MFVAAIVIITKKVETTQMSITDKWINKMWYMDNNKILLDNKKE